MKTIQEIWKLHLSPWLKGISPDSSEGLHIKMKKEALRRTKGGFPKGIAGVDAKLPIEVVEAIDRIMAEDKRQKAYLAGIDEDKFEYIGLELKEIVHRLQERGINW